MKTYTPSLLDKLLGVTADTPGRGGAVLRLGLEQIKESVARDIQALLNAHASYSAADLDGFPHARRSLLTLGLDDLTSLSMASDRDRLRITDAIRTALVEHDRRLQDVDVRVRPAPAAIGGLSFTIRARLRLHPDVQPVLFDAVLQPGSQRYLVRKGDARAAAAEA